MFQKLAWRITAFLLCAASSPALHLAAQDTQSAPSVAEAARRSRQQKQNASKPSTVLTNDTLPPAPDSTTNNAANANTSTETLAPESQPAAPEDADGKQSEIDALKKQIAEKQQALDILQRESNLEQENFYRKQDYQRDNEGKQKLDSIESDLKTKQDELNSLKAKLTDLAGADALKQPSAPAAAPAQPKP